MDTEIYLYDNEGNEIIEIETDNEEILFWGDFVFKSSENVTGKVFLLKNFELCPFSLNGSEYLFCHDITIPSSNEYLYSTENSIAVQALDLNKNDMCLIFEINSLIVTKRFQITNITSNKRINTVYQECFSINQKMERKIQYMKDKFNFIDTKKEQILLDEIINNQEIYCAIDIKQFLSDEQMEKDFKDRENKKISYVIVPIGYEKEINFFDPIYVKTELDTFGFSAKVDEIGSLVGMRFIIFPFSNEYNHNFLKTYKAFLWSSPIITYTIFKEEN